MPSLVSINETGKSSKKPTKIDIKNYVPNILSRIVGLSILDIGKTIMYELWYDYMKPKYREKSI